MSSWAQLTETIPEEQREELAAALLDALAVSSWCEVTVETRDHHLHAVSVKKSKLFHHPRVTKVACTA